jgi:hypothetical protein
MRCRARSLISCISSGRMGGPTIGNRAIRVSTTASSTRMRNSCSMIIVIGIETGDMRRHLSTLGYESHPLQWTAMEPIRIHPTHRQSHRYRGDELCGPLPPVLYKRITNQYAHTLVEHGEMMWSTLAYFQHLEAAGRGDKLEGRYNYVPADGLSIHRSERDRRPDDTTFILPPGHGYVSRAAQAAHIFIYSLTLDPALELDGADSCVEIFDPPQFVRRVREELSRRGKVQGRTCMHDAIKYWSPTNPPETAHALPHLLTMHKHEDFQPQKEYRLAFGIRSSVFDFQNVDYFIANDETDWPRVEIDMSAHRKKVWLGALTDCCRIM